MNEKHSLESSTDPEKIIQLLEDKIYAHNSARINKHDGLLFSRIMQGDSGDIIAGIAGWTWANVCEITQLWVDEAVQKNGLGKLLLEAAEAEARDRGCSMILVKSYSFQAPRFYEKHGYRIEHMLKGFPEGHDYYTLTKRIA